LLEIGSGGLPSALGNATVEPFTMSFHTCPPHNFQHILCLRLSDYQEWDWNLVQIGMQYIDHSLNIKWVTLLWLFLNKIQRNFISRRQEFLLFQCGQHGVLQFVSPFCHDVQIAPPLTGLSVPRVLERGACCREVRVWAGPIGWCWHAKPRTGRTTEGLGTSLTLPAARPPNSQSWVELPGRGPHAVLRSIGVFAILCTAPITTRNSEMCMAHHMIAQCILCRVSGFCSVIC